MAEVTSHPPGAFCWIELGTSDQKAAKDFYTRLFGWSFVDNDMGPGMVMRFSLLFHLPSSHSVYVIPPSEPVFAPHAKRPL